MQWHTRWTDLFRRLRSRWGVVEWLSVIGLGASLFMLGRLQQFFYRFPGAVAYDDGDTVALAERLIDRSWLPYVDGCSHRGPLLYWIAAVFQLFSGRFNWSGARWLSITMTMLTALGIFLAGAVARRRIAGAVGAILYVWVLITYELGAGFGILGETVACPFSIFALVFAAVGLLRNGGLRRRCTWLLIAGVSSAFAGLAKQTSLGVIVPIVLWAGAAAWAPLPMEAAPSTPLQLGRRDKWMLVSSPVVGFLTPLIAVIVPYLIKGELRAFWYWFFGYNAQIYMAPKREINVRALFDLFYADWHWHLNGLGVVLVAMIATIMVGFNPRQFLKSYASKGFDITLTMLTVGMLLGSFAALRFFSHYFFPVFIFAFLMVGLIVEYTIDGVAKSGGSGAWAKAFAVLGILLLTVYAFDHRMRGLNKSRKQGGWGAMTPEPVCAFADKYSPPGESMFVWGFAGDLYVTCKRPLAARYATLTFVAGVVPDVSWHGPEDRYVVPGSRAVLLGDLKQARPGVIFDVPQDVGSIDRVPELRSYLESEYCKMTGIKTRTGRAATPWVRKVEGRCPSS